MAGKRPYGIAKRRPLIEADFQDRFRKIPKARWAELYRDLYRQTHGEDGPTDGWIEDAESRIETLKANGL